jgi:hypothetical protein
MRNAEVYYVYILLQVAGFVELLAESACQLKRVEGIMS